MLFLADRCPSFGERCLSIVSRLHLMVDSLPSKLKQTTFKNKVLANKKTLLIGRFKFRNAEN